jgi:SAM-dependent methyltransferase
MNISEIDVKHYHSIRNNVSDLIKKMSEEFDNENLLVLDIAPQVHKGVKEFFHKSKIETLDIDELSNCTYICDICKNNSEIIEDEKYDVIFITEVLEHTNNPFDAVNELFRMVKKNGIVVSTTPFNFRIHNPLPDNWRFTEHGLRVLFQKFESVEVSELEDKNRFLMPIHYTLIAKK